MEFATMMELLLSGLAFTLQIFVTTLIGSLPLGVDVYKRQVFNLFGTATTALCAKPGYAFDAVTHESYYLNIGGNVEKVYTVGLDEIERMDSKIQKMRCTCGMSPALAMASVKGVKVSDMLSMTDIAPEVNTITFKDKDG